MFPFQLILFFDLFFFLYLYCIGSGDPSIRSFLPVGVSFRLIINQFIWIWSFLTSLRAEVCEEQEWQVGFLRPRAYAWHTLWCFVKETPWKQTRQTGGATSASPPEPSKISRQMLNFGGLFRQLLHAFLQYDLLNLTKEGLIFTFMLRNLCSRSWDQTAFSERLFGIGPRTNCSFAFLRKYGLLVDSVTKKNLC